MEIGIESVNKDNSHSWVRISHGLNTLVTDLIDKEYDDNEQETSEKTTEVLALKMKVFAFASRSKATTTPRRPTSACSSTRTVPIRERIWTDIEPGTQSNQSYPVAKRLNTLLRHGQLPREEDGAIEFWRLKDDRRNEFEKSQYCLMKCEEQNGRRRRQQEKISICADPSGQEILYLRAFQGHSGRNPIDPTLQDKMLILDNSSSTFVCSQFTLHHKFRIDSERTKFKQGKTDSIFYGCESHGQGSQRSV